MLIKTCKYTGQGKMLFSQLFYNYCYFAVIVGNAFFSILCKIEFRIFFTLQLFSKGNKFLSFTEELLKKGYFKFFTICLITHSVQNKTICHIKFVIHLYPNSKLNEILMNEFFESHS